jgi:heptosyltransferase II
MHRKNNPIKLGRYRTTTTFRALLMLSVDVLGYLFLHPYVIYRRFKGAAFQTENVLRIAVFRLDGIGDLVLSGPALRGLRTSFPKAHITLFVNDWSVGLAELLEGPDEIVALMAPLFKSFKGAARLKDIWMERNVLKKIGKKKRFDLAIDLRGDFLSILSAWWLGAKWFASRSSRGGGFLLTNVISQPNEGRMSEVDLNTEFVVLLTGQSLEKEKARLRPIPDSVRQSLISKMPASVGKDYLCMAVSAPYESRCYPIKEWIKVIELIQETYDKPILILGGQNDRERCASVADLADENVHSLAGQLSMVESIACIAGSRLVIGNDGGLIHVASALNRPVIQLFGPDDPVCFGHYGEHEHIIHKHCPCNPCAQNTGCRIPENWCMARIDPTEIADIAKQYLL